jgi:hypothetical protein
MRGITIVVRNYALFLPFFEDDAFKLALINSLQGASIVDIYRTYDGKFTFTRTESKPEMILMDSFDIGQGTKAEIEDLELTNKSLQEQIDANNQRLKELVSI